MNLSWLLSRRSETWRRAKWKVHTWDHARRSDTLSCIEECHKIRELSLFTHSPIRIIGLVLMVQMKYRVCHQSKYPPCTVQISPKYSYYVLWSSSMFYYCIWALRSNKPLMFAFAKLFYIFHFPSQNETFTLGAKTRCFLSVSPVACNHKANGKPNEYSCSHRLQSVIPSAHWWLAEVITLSSVTPSSSLPFITPDRLKEIGALTFLGCFLKILRGGINCGARYRYWWERGAARVTICMIAWRETSLLSLNSHSIFSPQYSLSLPIQFAWCVIWGLCVWACLCKWEALLNWQS